jgi:CBS domain-containing protein
MDQIDELLREKGTQVHEAVMGTTVFDAIAKMCAAHVGALLVCDGSRPVGIFTERDAMQRVVLARRDPATTRIGDVMTPNPICIEPSTNIKEAMAIMTDRRCRHLPVVKDGRIAGMISIGDLVRWESRHQQFELRELEDYITGKYPG